MTRRFTAAALFAAIVVFPTLAPAAELKAVEPPVSAEPRTTTASYGDWILRCQRVGETEKAVRICELVLTIQAGPQPSPIAELAMGRLSKSDPYRVTAHLPTNIALPSTVKFSLGAKDPRTQELAWRSCAPVGCFADAQLSEAQWKSLYAQAEPGSLEYVDSVGRPVKLPVSFRGLPQAMDALAKE
ncbi:invasion associated locus B family protein [Rhodoblastus sp.]|uniref:invasion associated locus B family protein n=1 Tax=Rhodoblastus sp. TaxID=1962975 RepID=UPI003F961103